MRTLRHLNQDPVALHPHLATGGRSESFSLVWCDIEDWFHNHVKLAMRMSALTIEATARHHALNGFDEVQVFQGKICWKVDPKLAGLDDEALTMLGYADRYEHNPDGSLIR